LFGCIHRYISSFLRRRGGWNKYQKQQALLQQRQHQAAPASLLGSAAAAAAAAGRSGAAGSMRPPAAKPQGAAAAAGPAGNPWQGSGFVSSKVITYVGGKPRSGSGSSLTGAISNALGVMSQQQWQAEAVEAEEQALGLVAGEEGGGNEGGNGLRDYYFDDEEEGLDEEDLRAAGLLL
jgi:hypothetical protein